MLLSQVGGYTSGYTSIQVNLKSRLPLFLGILNSWQPGLRDFKLTCIPTLLVAPPPKQYSTPTHTTRQLRRLPPWLVSEPSAKRPRYAGYFYCTGIQLVFSQW